MVPGLEQIYFYPECITLSYSLAPRRSSLCSIEFGPVRPI